MPTKEEYLSTQKRREEAGEELRLLTAELVDISGQIRGKRLHPGDYRRLCARQTEIKKQRLYKESEIRRLKLWLHNNNHLNPNEIEYKKTHGNGKTLDEYDLGNALAEPQSLLHKAYVRLSAMWKHYGISEADRGLKDTIEDYLKRHGIMLATNS